MYALNCTRPLPTSPSHVRRPRLPCRPRPRGARGPGPRASPGTAPPQSKLINHDMVESRHIRSKVFDARDVPPPPPPPPAAAAAVAGERRNRSNNGQIMVK